MNRAEHQRLAVEVALLKAATFPRLRAVEEALGSGAQATRPATTAPRPEPPARPAPPSRSGYDAAAPRTTTPAAQPAPPPAARAAAIEEPPAPVRRGPSGSNDPQELVERVRATRPMIGSYLAGARDARKDGSTITFLFEPAQSFFAEQVTNNIKSLEELAATIYGEPTKVVVTTDKPEADTSRRAEDKPSPLREDPVVKSFARHLGGEISEPRKR